MGSSRKMRRQAEQAHRKAHRRAAFDAPAVTLPPFPEGPGLSFDEAVAAVAREDRCYWAWEPRHWRGMVVGGSVWALGMDEVEEPEPGGPAREPWLYVTGNEFRSDMGEVDSYPPEDAPDDARALRYYPGPATLPDSMHDMDVAVPLFALLGRSEEEAHAFLDALPGPH